MAEPDPSAGPLPAIPDVGIADFEKLSFGDRKVIKRLGDAKSDKEKIKMLLERTQKHSIVTPYQFKVLSELLSAENSDIESTILSYHQSEDKEPERSKMHIDLVAALIRQEEKRWEMLYQVMPTEKGKNLSMEERDKRGINGMRYIYGEVTFGSLALVLWGSLKLKPGGVFYDLGSGTGRGVFAAALLHNWDKLVGIEYLGSLHDAAEVVLAKYDKEEIRPARNRAQRVQFIKGSFLEVDWSDGDLVFANSTCFDEDLLQEIAKKIPQLKEGAYVITFTKLLKSPYLLLLSSKQYLMSWGPATVHIFRRQKPSLAVFEEGSDVD